VTESLPKKAEKCHVILENCQNGAKMLRDFENLLKIRKYRKKCHVILKILLKFCQNSRKVSRDPQNCRLVHFPNNG